jgi:hypothetical protein
MRYGVYVPIFGPYGDALVLANLAYEQRRRAGTASFPGIWYRGQLWHQRLIRWLIRGLR